MRLPELGITRPITTAIFLASLLVMGAISWRFIPLRLLPAGLDPPFLGIWIRYPNSSPEDNARMIVEPLEEELWTVKGIKQIRSRSDRERCGIWMEFYGTTDMNAAYLEVKERIERARPYLPSDLKHFFIRRFGDNESPVVWFTIVIEDKLEDPYRLIKDEIVDALQKIDGVAAVEMWGGDPKEIRVELSMEKLKRFHIDISQVADALRQADFALSAGNIYDGGTQFIVKSSGRITNLAEIAELPIPNTRTTQATALIFENKTTANRNTVSNYHTVSPSGTFPILRLKEIAQVHYSPPPRQWVQRMDGMSSVDIEVFKESESNTVNLCRDINRVVDEFRSNPKLKGLRFEMLFDEGYYIRRSLNNLFQAGLWGGLFAILVLFYFLRQASMTLFVTSAIPLSILTTITFLYFLGWSLNIVTLSGMMIAVGMVVDNAIVVTENIYSLRQSGENPLKASILGANQVALAITLATTTTMVVFLPIMVLGENKIFTFYVSRLGVPVIIALASSLLIALLLIPLATFTVAKWKPHSELRTFPPSFNTFKTRILRTMNYGRGSRTIARWSERVEEKVRWAIQNRFKVLIGAIILLGTTAFPISKVVSVDEEEGHINDINLHFSFPGYYTLNDIDSLMTKIEKQIQANQEKYQIKTIVTRFRRGFGRMNIFLKEQDENNWLQVVSKSLKKVFVPIEKMPLSREKIIKDIKEGLNLPPGVKWFTSWRRGSRDENVTYINLFGEDMSVLETIAEEVKGRISKLPEVVTTENDPTASAEELNLLINREESYRWGINSRALSYGISALIRGIPLKEIQLNEVGAQVPMRLELREEDRVGLDRLLNLQIVSSREEAVRLGDIASPQLTRSSSEIVREGRRKRVAIRITVTEGNVKKFGRKLEQALRDINLPPNYLWTKGQRFFDIEEQEKQQQSAWLMAATFVMLLMSALFESVLLPWAVIITVPFSFFGVWWLFWITGTQFGIMAAIGVIILIGVVVNNAIVLVDRINQLRAEGLPRDDAVAIGAHQRFRPMMMTALTTILGLMPMALGNTSLFGIPYAPLGRALIGGLITSTLFTPIMVPILYTYLDDLNGKFQKLKLTSILNN